MFEDKGDGWNQDLLEEVGVLGLLDEVCKFKYDLENCQRGAYVGIGSTDEDLLNELLYLKKGFGFVIGNIKSLLKGK